MDQFPLFAANVSAIQNHSPNVPPALLTEPAQVSRLVMENGDAVNIDLGQGMLYAEPVEQSVAKQLAAYAGNPKRIVMNQPSGVGMDSAVSLRMANRLINEFRKRGTSQIPAAPLGRTGYMILLGIGLGRHIRRLLDLCDVRELLIVEPFPEFFQHSLRCTDWADIIACCDERNIQITFIFERTPERIVELIGTAVGRTAGMFLDGTYLFTHYNSWIFNDVHERLSKSVQHYFISKGYFEDEIKMINNTSGNFLRHRFRLIENKTHIRRKEPVFIVGSGPSIDSNIDVVAKWREHAMLFSIGTGLQVLLSHGIVPDYHCELENGPHVPEVLGHVHSKYSFDGIKLIASSTVNPKAADLFDEAYFFFRDSVSSTHTLGAGYASVKGVAPTVSNVALTISTLLGFHEVYLFGVDCGSRNPVHQHSPRSIYGTMEGFKDRPQKPYSIVHPGNFGGTVSADWIFDLARRMLEDVQRHRKARLFNCSDGALIAGATPKLASTLNFATPLDRAAVAESVRNSLPLYEPMAFFEDQDLGRFLAGCTELLEEGRAMLAAAMAEDETLMDFHDRLAAFVREADQKYSGVARVISGSLMAFPRVATYFLPRCPTEEMRAEVFAVFLQEYLAIFEEMVSGTRELFSGVIDRIEENKATAA